MPGLEAVLEAGQDLIDVIEIEPQQFWFKSTEKSSRYRNNRDALERIGRFKQPKLVHGVGFPVGGTVPSHEDHLAPFLEAINWFGAPWVSEHLSFNRARDRSREFNTGFLLPPLQTPETVGVAAANIRKLRAYLPVPFAFETGVNYMRPQPGEMSDGTFFRAVAEEADCGILLDLHNLWANEQNGREALLDVVDELPRERVWEVHLAGGHDLHGYWLDAHSGLLPAPLVGLAEKVLPYLPNLRALVFEIMPDYIQARNFSVADLVDQIRMMRELWVACKRRAPTADVSKPCPTHSSAPAPGGVPAAAEWEQALGKLTIGWETEGPLAARLSVDPGVRVFRELVGSVRAGMTVTALTLTCRYLMLSLGETRFRDLLAAFWKTEPPSIFASEEAENFAVFLRKAGLEITHLNEVLEFEISAQKVLIEGAPRTVCFQCEPMPLLTALGEGRLPDAVKPGHFELVIEPTSAGERSFRSLP